MSENLPERLIVNSIKERSEKDESEKLLITEMDLRGLEEGARLIVSKNARFTPLAEDFIREKKIEVVRKSKDLPVVRSIAIGADHGGFHYKEKLKNYLSQKGFRVYDFGTNSKEAVDYPDFAHAVAKAVSEGKVDIGILIDGAGIGSAIAANKVPGVRAAACYNAALAKNSREHNGANVLTLGSGQNSFEQVIEIVDVFLRSGLTEERHARRVGKIESIERQYLK
ncbi:MAG: ribose 5-phosphate isomerase B [Pyrinomonadaceae bacterium]|nr:ribose 5-phosphate isomerase B [Pyrinomonadaceae bacterium]MCX7639922.1 ribose 5-phosphate isomerase B [Pyrinomonadaceae bacterium]MDW8304094.1 ribose 5-phosphate isomerase B [Acidobacteriota bacterium]